MHFISCIVLIILIALATILDRWVFSFNAPYVGFLIATILAIRNSYRAVTETNDSATGKGFHSHGNADATFVLTTMVLVLGGGLGLMVSLIPIPNLNGLDLYSWMLSPVVYYSLVYGSLMEFFLENKNRVCERAMDLERLFSLITTITIGIYSFLIYRQGDVLFNPIVITIAIMAAIRLIVTMLFREISVTVGVKDDRSNLW